MTDKARIRLAAAVTALFLAGISAAGLAARDDQPRAATTAARPTVPSSTPSATTDASPSSEGRGDSERYQGPDEIFEELEDDE